ncbi:MAG TPA: hypothetical protein VM487_25480 [Phycisphaerae bacterium]|nr:hypothetical protein [Phycisphaerae bacterium]
MARALRRAGLGVQVVAPGRSPRPAARQTKSDRLDGIAPAEYAAKGLLVAVPSETEEADRQVQRLRDQLVKKRRTVKQQIKSFLLQHGLDEPCGLTCWSLAARAARRQGALGPQLRLCLDVLLDLLEQIEAHVRAVERALRALADIERHAEAAVIARTHPGARLCARCSSRPRGVGACMTRGHDGCSRACCATPAAPRKPSWPWRGIWPSTCGRC